MKLYPCWRYGGTMGAVALPRRQGLTDRGSADVALIDSSESFGP